MSRLSVYKSSRREALKSISAMGLCIGSTALTACSGSRDEALVIDNLEAPTTGVDDGLSSEIPFADTDEFAPVEPTEPPIKEYGPLQDPDQNGIALPMGFQSRIVAITGEKPVEGSDYVWHGAPDGGAVFSTDTGWVYLSNAELNSKRGGVGALEFNSAGDLISAYPVLTGTSRNCAGGAMPWGTWLSCEEVAFGGVWECQPLGGPARFLPALGLFKHEAVCADPVRGHLYLTEDEPDGCLYRFTPAGRFDDLSRGTLQVLQIVEGASGKIEWLNLDDPSARDTPTRFQSQRSARFDGGEGICLQDDKIFFATKGDGRVWELDIDTQALRIFYDDDNYEYATLNGLDGITPGLNPKDILVAEDGGDMQVVSLSSDGRVTPVLQVPGQLNSEITGVAFDPSGTRLYFSSQRGFDGNGITYEISGPFAYRS